METHEDGIRVEIERIAGTLRGPSARASGVESLQSTDDDGRVWHRARVCVDRHGLLLSRRGPTSRAALENLLVAVRAMATLAGVPGHLREEHSAEGFSTDRPRSGVRSRAPSTDAADTLRSVGGGRRGD